MIFCCKAQYARAHLKEGTVHAVVAYGAYMFILEISTILYNISYIVMKQERIETMHAAKAM